MTRDTDLMNDYFLAGIVHTLKSMKTLQEDKTDSLDNIDFDYLIERRMRDMMDVNVLDNIENIDTESEEFK
tara:strand:+ start:1469 stop:1681 length:213 start_codon:yes stop_codon:yes gene_type:complete